MAYRPYLVTEHRRTSSGKSEVAEMPPICNTSLVAMCPHGGTVNIPPKQTKVMIGGSLGLRALDASGSAIAGCSQLPTLVTPTYVPCSVVASPAQPASTKVMISGLPAMLSSG